MAYDEEKAERVIRWIEKYCSHVKGSKGGQPFKLEQWQKDDIIRPLFGTLREDGLRQYRTCYVEIPRKNGKSTLCAALALYLLCADDEPGAEVISAAADRNQARIVFDVALGMVEQNRELKNRLKCRQHAIHYKTSFYKSISAEANTKHGFNCHGVIFDELHAQKDGELWRVLSTSMGSRNQPMMLAITTAGHDTSSICYEVHDYAMKVKDGSVDDPAFLPVIYAADKGDDWTKEETWKKANPGYGSICMKDYFEQEVRKCQHNPREVNTFLRLHLNIWTSSEERWISDDEFMRGKEAVPETRLASLPCYIGLDLSSTKDLTAVGMLWRDDELDRFYLKCQHFVNAEMAHSKKLSGGIDYEMFSRQGFVTITDGNVNDMDAVRRFILDACAKYDVRMVAYDRWNAHTIVPQLVEKEIPVEPFGQGFRSMAYPTKMLEVEMCKGNIIHGAHPVLRWQMGCVHLQRDEADNIKVTKKKNSPSQKVDGIVACIMALGTFYNNSGEEEFSFDIVHL